MEGSNSRSTPTNEESASRSSQSQSHRQKTDITWRYVIEGKNSEGKRVLICQYCRSIFAGEGINRMKHHLAKVKGNVAPCKEVPPDVRMVMENALKENAQKSKEKKGNFEIENPFGQSVEHFEGDDIEEIPRPKGKGSRTNVDERREKRKAQHGIEAYMTDEWWRLFGNDAPHLQKLAIKLLSQTSSSSGCERNWSVFERIHTKKRNRLEHQRLNDLVYIHYNLRLKNRLSYKKRSYDPVDYEAINKVEFWIIDEEQEGELDYDELEEMIEEELPKTSEDGPSQSRKKDTNTVQLDDEDDLDDINFESYGTEDGDDEEEDEAWLR